MSTTKTPLELLQEALDVWTMSPVTHVNAARLAEAAREVMREPNPRAMTEAERKQLEARGAELEAACRWFIDWRDYHRARVDKLKAQLADKTAECKLLRSVDSDLRERNSRQEERITKLEAELNAAHAVPERSLRDLAEGNFKLGDRVRFQGSPPEPSEDEPCE